MRRAKEAGAALEMVVLEAVGAVVGQVLVALAVREPEAMVVGMWSALYRPAVGWSVVEFGRFWRERFDVIVFGVKEFKSD